MLARRRSRLPILALLLLTRQNNVVLFEHISADFLVGALEGERWHLATLQ